jgi:NTP pyrophosphatase (non-canonical NTP hydrolase)
LKTLQDVQREIDHLVKEEWQSYYWTPLSNLARLTEEVGELAREINHYYGEKPKKSNESQGNVAAEMGDILYTLAAIANSLDIDLETAFDGVMAKYRQRDNKRWNKEQ